MIGKFRVSVKLKSPFNNGDIFYLDHKSSYSGENIEQLETPIWPVI